MSRGLSRYTSDPAFLASVLTSPAPAARPSAASNTSYAPSSSSYPASNTPSTSSSMASTQPIQGRSITEQEIEGILRMASMSNSSVLTLSGHNLSDEHVVYFLADALVRYCISAANPWKVKEIHVSKCGLTMKGLEVLVHNALLFLPAIEVLKLTHNNFTRETGAVLAQYLQQTHANQLRVVDLSYNSLGDLGVTALSQAWNEVKPSLLSLHTLDLSHNDFGDAGILALCRGLLQFYRRTGSGQKSGNVGIKTLHLNGCKMTDRGAQCIAQLITSNLASSSRGSSPRPLASSSSSSSMASLASAINNNSAGYPLEELTLEACPCLSSTGIMLLFGDPHFSIASPLQRLSISKNTFLSLDLIQHLAYCIQYGVSQLEILYLDFTMEVARDVIKAALRGEHGGINLSGSIKELVDTLLNINHTRPVYMKRIQCGALHPILFETCIQMKEILQQAAYEDCLKALEYMNPAAQIFVIPYITNVSLWVRGKTYFNDLYVIPTPTVINVKDKTKEASPEKQRAFFPSNGNSPRASSATSNTSRQSTPTGLLAAGGIKSPTLHQQLQQEKEKIQKTVKYAPDVMPSNDQQAPQQSTMSTSHVDQSMMHADGNALLDMKTYANQHPASSEPANQNTTNSSQQVTQLAAAPLVVNSSEINVELLELKEQEYLRLRKSQSSAFSTLSNEIRQLVQQSPAPPPTAGRSYLDGSSPLKLASFDSADGNNKNNPSSSQANPLVIEDMSPELQQALAMIASKQQQKQQGLKAAAAASAVVPYKATEATPQQTPMTYRESATTPGLDLKDLQSAPSHHTAPSPNLTMRSPDPKHTSSSVSRSRSTSPNSQRIAHAMIQNSPSTSRYSSPMRSRTWSDPPASGAKTLPFATDSPNAGFQANPSRAPTAADVDLASQPLFVQLAAEVDNLTKKQNYFEQELFKKLANIEERLTAVEKQLKQPLKGEQGEQSHEDIHSNLANRLESQLQQKTLRGIASSNVPGTNPVTEKERVVLDELAKRLEAIEGMMQPTPAPVATPAQPSAPPLSRNPSSEELLRRKDIRQANLEKLLHSNQQYDDDNNSVASLYSLPKYRANTPSSNKHELNKQYFQELLGGKGGVDEELEALFKGSKEEEEEDHNDYHPSNKPALPSLPLTAAPSMDEYHNHVVPVARNSSIPPNIHTLPVEAPPTDFSHQPYDAFDPNDAYVPEYEYDTLRPSSYQYEDTPGKGMQRSGSNGSLMSRNTATRPSRGGKGADRSRSRSPEKVLDMKTLSHFSAPSQNYMFPTHSALHKMKNLDNSLNLNTNNATTNTANKRR